MSDHLPVQLKVLSTKLEELIAEFHGTAGFGWYEGHLQQVVEDIRRHKEVDQWLESRKELGKLIDPATAEAKWRYAQSVEPYGVLRVPRISTALGAAIFSAILDLNGFMRAISPMPY